MAKKPKSAMIDGNLSAVRQQMLGDGLPRFAGVAVWRANGMRPDFWPADAPSGLLNWTDEEEKRMLTMYALSGNKLTWMAATVWPSHKQDQLGSRRDIAQSDDTTTSADPGGRRNRCLEALSDAKGLGVRGFGPRAQ
ncbi:hypothetical protein CVIRNUC_005595 [Coccomyxa viridis]|uniref:Myb-like domain-containing protein n=1 Tax=Coccomyxa viridis TaxID=1274662 RepID=A0AAV1I4V4_9CHLO|nr:hypothetical protein CVIRNUC_005595 [Coccomyxa viridis]